jgi:hypothetical protein
MNERMKACQLFRGYFDDLACYTRIFFSSNGSILQPKYFNYTCTLALLMKITIIPLVLIHTQDCSGKLPKGIYPNY